MSESYFVMYCLCLLIHVWITTDTFSFVKYEDYTTDQADMLVRQRRGSNDNSAAAKTTVNQVNHFSPIEVLGAVV